MGKRNLLSISISSHNSLSLSPLELGSSLLYSGGKFAAISLDVQNRNAISDLPNKLPDWAKNKVDIVGQYHENEKF